MLGNTLTLTIAGVAVVMTKTDPGLPFTSEYRFRDADHQLIARIRHNRTKATATRPSVDRHNFELVETVFADGTVAEFERKCYFVLEQSPQDTNVSNFDAVCDWAIASSNAALVSLLGWET